MLLCPWDSPDKKTAVRCHALIQGVFLIQGSNPHLLTTSTTWEEPPPITMLTKRPCLACSKHSNIEDIGHTWLS